MTRIDQRRSATRPGEKPGLVVSGLDFREMEGGTAINFDDHISEQHAEAVVNLLRPLLVGDWEIRPAPEWGRYTIKDPGWTDHFVLIFLFRIDEIKVTVRLHKFPSQNEPKGKFDTIPLECPNTIELLAQFVFEELVGYERQILINRPILSATP